MSDVLSFWFERGCAIVPDDFFPTAEPVLLQSLSEIEDYVKGDPFRFMRGEVVIPDVSIHPLKLGRASRPEGERWYVAQRYGGPTIQIARSRWITNERGTCRIGGDISHYPYYLLDSAATIEVPGQMREMYAEACALIREMTVACEVGPLNQGYRVGKGFVADSIRAFLPDHMESIRIKTRPKKSG